MARTRPARIGFPARYGLCSRERLRESKPTETFASRVSARPLNKRRPRDAGARHGADEIDFALRNISGNTRLLAGMGRTWPSRTASPLRCRIDIGVS